MIRELTDGQGLRVGQKSPQSTDIHRVNTFSHLTVDNGDNDQTIRLKSMAIAKPRIMSNDPSKELRASPIARGTVVELKVVKLRLELSRAVTAFGSDPSDSNLAAINTARDRLQAAMGWAPP